MANISGVGALFIHANEPSALAEWYQSKLGFGFSHSPSDNSHYGELRDPASGLTVYLAIVPAKTELPYGNRGMMVNYKVNEFDVFVAKLQKSGVTIEKRRGDGASKFAYISDPEGNPIELWSGV
ncbi:MAG: VOC family protein [Planctomycetota bacterium]